MINLLARYWFLLPFCLALSLYAQISPNSSANAEADRNVASEVHSVTNRSLPVLFIVGDSTVHNPGKGERGWGDVIGKFFDPAKIIVENHALGGRSSRTFQTQGWWDKVLAASRPGDWVIIQMGHNDSGPLDDTNRARGSIRGLGEETKTIYNPLMKKTEVVHTYGWYLRKYIADARAHGLNPILCSPVPHCPRTVVKTGELENNDHVRDSAAVAASEKTPFISLNGLIMNHYAGLPTEEIKAKYFTPADNTHSSPAGAELNAAAVVEGLRLLTNCPLVETLKAQ